METYAIKAPLEGVQVIGIKYTRDERGFFIESYHQQRFAEVGIEGGYRVAHRCPDIVQARKQWHEFEKVFGESGV